MEGPEKYLSAYQIKELNGKSVQYIHKCMADLNCPYKLVPGRGKPSKHYSLSGLPSDIQNLYVKKYKAKANITGDQSNLPVLKEKNDLKSVSITDLIVAPETDNKNDSWYDTPKTLRENAFERFRIVNGAREIRLATKKGKGKALKKYARQVKRSFSSIQRDLKIANEALAVARETGADELLSQLKALTPQYGKNKNKFRSYDEEAIAFALSLFLSQKCLTTRDIWFEVVNMGEIKGWRVGSYDSLLEIFRRVDGATVTLARKGKKAFEANHQIKILRNYEEIPPNFMWCGDHHIFDVFVKVPDSNGGWKPMRPWLTAWMDMRSRSFMGWVISFSPNSMTIAMALAHAISFKNDPNFPQYGLPFSVCIDNGKDYRCIYLNGELVSIGRIDYPEIIEKYKDLGIDPFYIDLEYDPEENAWVKKRGQKEITVKGVRVGGVYSVLNIGRHYATAYHPWAKPIERAFRNVVQSFSRQLPGWCGSGHNQRPEKLNSEIKSGNLLTVDEFCEAFYNWVVNKYHKTPHSGHGMNGMTPDQVFTSLLPKPQSVDPKLLDFALMKKERVKIYNWGFHLNGRKFEMDLPDSLHGGHIASNLIGKFCQVLYDYNYRAIRVYNDGKFICDAKPLNRASFITPDDPAMVEKLKLQSYQKKVSTGIINGIHSLAEKAVSPSESLLRLTHGYNNPSLPEPSETPNQSNDKDEDDCIIPLNEDERYRLILRRRANGKDLNKNDQDFVTEYERTKDYLDRKRLYDAEFESMRYENQKKGACV